MFTSLAAFHPGHGTTAPSSLIHYVTEPMHVVTLVLSAVALLGIAGALWRLALRSSKKI